MLAIQTKYLGPTNSRGARITASAKSFKVIIPYPYELDGVACHFNAVKALIDKNKLDWPLENMRYGENNQGYVFCFDASKVEL
jgi:hypothetical protein